MAEASSQTAASSKISSALSTNLIPSQADNAKNLCRTRKNRRSRKNGKKNENSTTTSSQPPPLTSETLNHNAKEFVPNNPTESSGKGNEEGQKQKKRRPRRKNNGKKTPPIKPVDDVAKVDEQSQSSTQKPAGPDVGSLADANDGRKTRKKQQRQRKRNRNKYSWRAQIPEGAVDPISLDPLVSLSYPPFALAAEEPYEIIPTWPVPPDKSNVDNPTQKNEDKIETNLSGDASSSKDKASSKDYVHLYDGRVLAYYLVSQLQFIDPLNRRDLNRLELINLDQYMARHKLGRANVAEAYDKLGITKSLAGQAGQTQEGRSEILQMEARSVLTSLFERNATIDGAVTASAGARGGRSDSRGATRRSNARSDRDHGTDTRTAVSSEFQNEFERHYIAHERTENVRNAGRRQQPSEHSGGNGILHHEEGIIFIDDDENPGLRGAGRPRGGRATSTAESNNERVWNTNSFQVRGQDLFPALPPVLADSTVPLSSSQPTSTAPSASKAPSKSLRSISKIVTKTDPAQAARQKKAREEAQKRAALSQMSFVLPDNAYPQTTHVTHTNINSHSIVQNTDTPSGPSDSMLKRNQRWANALGVAPATVRTFNEGWARPTETKIETDEFGNELNKTIYPDALIISARENIGFLLKVERHWKAFLMDDKNASLSLRPMNRQMRILVHEYSDFWRMQTESFDLEPKRYIHCVKLKDTNAPYPLLTEAAKTQRLGGGNTRLPDHNGGNGIPVGATGKSSMDDTKSVPASSAYSNTISAPPGAMFDLAGDKSEASTLSNQNFATGLSLPVTVTRDAQEASWSRFSALARERPMLNLAPRTIPRELQEFEKVAKLSEYRLSRSEKERIKKSKQEIAEIKKKNILADAFDSGSSDSENDNAELRRQLSGDESSDWEVEEAEYDSNEIE
eukprot:CAMPEP_0195525436 /NCGR_PEP_ID=MMETSP0794_2-20130614/25907_1 /TAXON_ID=515487 /ORGANISM="Stephanopyxis turris, Strain CCMP 815" /LENGTH=910 /DNA_ID=CAMNT_0040655903 /DNA_START=120 /DNA_END=2852 /DNA_ORIENTATION=+